MSTVWVRITADEAQYMKSLEREVKALHGANEILKLARVPEVAALAEEAHRYASKEEERIQRAGCGDHK